MLSTDSALLLVAILGFVALISSLIAFSLAMKAVTYGRQAIEYVASQNAADVSLAKLAEIETAITELTDSYAALLTSHKKLRSRIGMREVRERRKNGQDELDLSVTTDKNQLRQELRAKGLLK